MRCYLSEETVNTLNNLLRDFFKANSTVDNLSYSLQSQKMYNTANLIHHKFAHRYPEIADEISGVMDALGARALRVGFDGDTESYEDVVEILKTNVSVLEHLRNTVLSVLEVLDYDINNKEVCLVLEDVAKELLEMLYNANKILDFGEYYISKGKILEFDFKSDDLGLDD